MNSNLEDFINYLKFEKRFSQHTIIAYQKDIEDLLNWTLEQGYEDVEKIDSKLLRIYFSNLKELNFDVKTINRKISSSKTFFKFLQREETIKINPTEKLQILKKPKQLPFFVTEQKIESLFDTIYNSIDFSNYDEFRNLLILELFYSTGIRLSELIELEIFNISKSPSSIKVLGKRNKERIIPLHKNISELIEKFSEIRQHIISVEEKKYLFLTKEGKKLYPKLVYNIVNNYLTQISTNKKLSPHILRHTFATHMLNNGADLNAIKEILGHAGLSSTQVYTHNSIGKLKEVYKNSHPRS
jgi:integrase/recombinase XerC